MRSMIKGAVLLAALFAWASPGAAETALRVRLNADIRSTDPGTNRDENTDAVVLHIVEGLVAFREDASVGPLLAEKWETNADGTVYRFTLRSGVSFHNGAMLTAADVVWSLNRYLDPKTGWRCLSEFDGSGATKIVSVAAEGERTVIVTLDKPSPLFLVNLSRQDCGGTGIVHRSSVGADGAWIAPIGTGPFKLGKWVRNESIELEAFPAYASRGGERDGNTGGKKAMVDRVRFVVVPDSSAARAALLSDAIDVLPAVAPAEVAGFSGRTDVTLTRNPILDTYAILLRSDRAPFNDVRVRRALAMAIDTKSLTGAVTMDTGAPNASAVAVPSAWHSPAHDAATAYDPAAAKALLAQSAYRGETIKLLANRRYPQMYDAAILVQAMAQAAGFNFELEVLDWATQLDRYGSGDYQAMSFSYSARLDPALAYGSFIGDSAKEKRKLWGDAAALGLLNEAKTATAKEARQAAFDALHAKMLEQVPLIVLYNPSQIIATRRNVTGMKGWAVVQPRLWNVALQP
jgi:peptide/nickel transport system substrate-binding protein